METLAQFEASRYSGKPVSLYLFDGSDTSLESMARSVVIGPAGEFGFGTTAVRQGTGETINSVTGLGKTDFVTSIDDLLAINEQIAHVTLQVAWHGDDLRAGLCTIKPKVESATTTTVPYAWQVANVTRDTADLLTKNSGDRPALPGAPSDRSVYEAILHLRNRGIRVTVMPIILMDIPSGNTLTHPSGTGTQPAYPSRSGIRVTDAADITAGAATQVGDFFGPATVGAFSWDATNLRVNYSGTGFRYRRFILHMATIAKAAGATGFLIGSRLSGLTQSRSGDTTYPAVARLRTLAADVRGILGTGVDISYSADWEEYDAHQPDGFTTFHLDPLWSDPDISFVGIENFMPTSDWRDGKFHADRIAGFPSIYDAAYHMANIEGGEHYDWRYRNQGERDSQIRTAIIDGAHGKDWMFRPKDIRGWWSNEHKNRTGSTETSTTGWVPRSKPIVFTMLGCRAIEKGSNAPSDGAPPYTNGDPDAAVQRAYLEAWLRYWTDDRNPWSTVYGGRMLRRSETSLAVWDARPHPEFPDRSDIWTDAGQWQKGLWLTGRMLPGRAFDAGQLGPFAYCNGEVPITRDGVVYQPWPIKHGGISADGSLDKADVSVTMALGSEVDGIFIAYPPSTMVNLTIFEGHVGSENTLANFPAVWMGRATGATYSEEEVVFSGVPVSTTTRRPGLRRHYQIGCPHVLYGEDCRASKRSATYTRTVTTISVNRVTIDTDITLGTGQQLAGGLLEWTDPITGRRELRTIAKASLNSRVLTIRGLLRGLTVGASVRVSRGCNHQLSGCTGFNNILNYGGQPFIPSENPLSNKSQFY